jgi:YHS domain-containing protein
MCWLFGSLINIFKKFKTSYDGWYWFDSEAEAREFFELPPLEEGS